MIEFLGFPGIEVDAAGTEEDGGALS